MPDTYVGRLAPSPTGWLHLGHAATFLVAAERAQAAGGVLRLRSEDLDRSRVRDEFAAAMVEDLAWLGIGWAGRAVVQSERMEVYRAAMERLVRADAVYPCRCSRRELMEGLGAPHEEGDDEPVYGGRCRPERGREAGLPRGVEEELREAGSASVERTRAALEGVNWRFRVRDGEVVRFTDGAAGEQAYQCGCGAGADFGDFLVWRKDGLPSYQLACVVDDAAMGVTEVVRGRDLLKSTARQILLGRALGYEAPRWFHTELLRGGAGVRLAKRHDALAIRALRERGIPAEAVWRMARERSGA